MAVQHPGSNWTADEDRRLLDLIEAGNARDLTASRPPPENLSARTDRVRNAKKQACKKWTLTQKRCRRPCPTILQLKFPVPVKKFPVLLNFFPVNFRRELLEQ
jgi:hypothetical protein